MFDGALSPLHLVIIAFALFMLVGPKRVAERFNHIGKSVQRFVDDDGEPDETPAGTALVPAPAPTRRGLGYRLGRLFRRRRRRRPAA